MGPGICTSRSSSVVSDGIDPISPLGIGGCLASRMTSLTGPISANATGIQDHHPVGRLRPITPMSWVISIDGGVVLPRRASSSRQ